MTKVEGNQCPRCDGGGKLPKQNSIAGGSVCPPDYANLIQCPDCGGGGTLARGASPIFVWQGENGQWIAKHYGSLEISAPFHDRGQAIEQVRIALRQEGLPATGEVRNGTGRAV